MPWYYVVNGSKTIGQYTLTPFDTTIPNPQLGTLDQEAKEIIRSYLTQPFTSAVTIPPLREVKVKKATIIQLNQGDLDFDEIEVLRYVISISGLADRDFRSQSLYLCSDNFNIIIQSYPQPIPIPLDPLIQTFNKYGSSSFVFSTNLFREVKPWHIPNQQIPGNVNYRLAFNEELAQNLWKFYKGIGKKKSVWEKHIFPSVFSYHFANTDGFPKHVDFIYSEAAIEKLFLGSLHGEDALVTKALAFIQSKNIQFAPLVSTTRNWQSITTKVGGTIPVGSIFEGWLRELVRLRNRYAHGCHSAPGTWVWSLSDHLLLSAFIYPLLLKLYISSYDRKISFTIDPDDVKRIRMFERILAQKDYFQDASPDITNWSQLLMDAFFLV